MTGERAFLEFLLVVREHLALLGIGARRYLSGPLVLRRHGRTVYYLPRPEAVVIARPWGSGKNLRRCAPLELEVTDGGSVTLFGYRMLATGRIAKRRGVIRYVSLGSLELDRVVDVVPLPEAARKDLAR